MIIPQSYVYNYDEQMSSEEYEVIYKFLAAYKYKEVIVADLFVQDFQIVPLEEENIVFKNNEDEYKNISFCRRIIHKEKSYVVLLNLYRSPRKKNSPNCLEISSLEIIADEKIHRINLDIQGTAKTNILFNIINIFDERKIISPEQAYFKKMHTNKGLQKLIANHDWEEIYRGIERTPSLANALFIIREGYETDSRFTADFGTILYQLISFRQNNLNNLDERDLVDLDKLIYKLYKTKLLKVQLQEHIDVRKCFKNSTTNSILLESDNYNHRVHRSQQYNITNTELAEENKALNKCLKNINKRIKL